METADGAVVGQQEGGAEEGLEGEGGTVVADGGAVVAQQEGGAEEGLDGEGSTVVAEDGAVRNHILVHVRSWWIHLQNQRHTFHNTFSCKDLCDSALSREHGCFNITEQ